MIKTKAEPIQFYRLAKRAIEASEFASEIEWQSSRRSELFTETDLLRECAWVVLCTGFKESVVRRQFPFISACFFEWESSHAISAKADLCAATALTFFPNTKKISSIIAAVKLVEAAGFERFRADAMRKPIETLSALPFIGPVTAFHLAKNLGFNVAKNDRHLQKLSAVMGFAHAQDLCAYISGITGDAVSVVDVVLWRYLERQSSRGWLIQPQIAADC